MYAVNHHLLFIHNFILGLDLKALALVSASRFWPRLMSLLKKLFQEAKDSDGPTPPIYQVGQKSKLLYVGG